MASVRAGEASSSSSRQPSNYHVFLSFRSEDIRNTFLAHLYTALSGAGFFPFRDNDCIRRGENINSEVEKAIREARSSIIVFSKGYASSRWCLDELVMIVQRKRTSGHALLPVFYHVDPSHVRKQTGSFAEAFGSYEEQIKMKMDEREKEHLRNKVEGWRAALREVADLAGMVLKEEADGDESIFIQKIVKEIGKNLNRRGLHVEPILIGMESRAKSIISWLQDDSADVGIVVIYGMGGIGKTTIAKFVYNLNFERFEASSFLANVREKSKEPTGLLRLQRQLLFDILRRKKEKINSVDEGITRIEEAIGCKRALVVLDDVDDKGQFEAIIGMRDYFHPRSKIILTTRRKDLLKANEVYRMHEVERFYKDEALELFSWHAFGQGRPIEGYFDHSERVIKHCGGIPLALKVIASSLYGKSSEVWESKLQKLATIPDSQILEKLKTSYDSLQDDHDRNLFLHIACFFIGMDKHFTVTILDECDFYTTIGIENLIDRCLLNINEHNKLMMHQLLRDMGREIISKESSNPGQRSRLWHHKDSFNVLREKTGTETIQGLFLDMHLLEEDRCSNRSFCIRNKKRPRFEELGDKSFLADQCNSWKRRCFGFLSWNPINMGIRNSDQEELKTDAFAGMRNLTLLQLHYVELKGSYKDFPKRLRWLGWHGFPLESVPNDFSLEFLVALDLRNSSLKQVWKGTKILGMLKILNLSHSHALANSPDFLQVPSLEKLVLKDCINLVGLHESIGKLGSLVLLNLRGCKNLRKLPREIFQLKSLEELDLSGCTRLEKFPSDLGTMGSSKLIHANEISQLSSTTGVVKPWYEVVWSLVSKPRRSPESIYFSLPSLPCSLVTLRLAKCNISSVDIPWNLGTMCSLREMDLSGNPICSLPELPMSLKILEVAGCESLKMLTNLPNLSTELNFGSIDCKNLVEVQELFKLAPVGNIDSEMVSKLGLAELPSNGTLQVALGSELTRISHKKASELQGLNECGIYSIFLRGREIPDWFDRKSRGGSSISITIPSLPNLKIQGLNVCAVYGYEDKRRVDSSYDEYIIVNNETRNTTWIYTPVFKAETWNNEGDLMWLSDWKIANQLMGPGDKVNVWVKMSMSCEVKEFGVRIVYGNSPTCHQNLHINLSNYQISKNEYFLRTEKRGKKLKELENWSKWIHSRRGGAKLEEAEFNDDGDAKVEKEKDWSTIVACGGLGIARSREGGDFLGSHHESRIHKYIQSGSREGGDFLGSYRESRIHKYMQSGSREGSDFLGSYRESRIRKYMQSAKAGGLEITESKSKCEQHCRDPRELCSSAACSNLKHPKE